MDRQTKETIIELCDAFHFLLLELNLKYPHAVEAMIENTRKIVEDDGRLYL